MIPNILAPYSAILGADFQGYSNHASRVYYYSITLLLMKQNKKLAIAAAFHDLDIWVNNDLDYLPGSAALACKYLKDQKLNYLPDEMQYIINNHHKMSRISGNIEAEAFRKADLIDLTGGRIKFNIPKVLIREIEDKYPRLNFSRTIAKKVIKHMLKNPLHPLPMLRS